MDTTTAMMSDVNQKLNQSKSAAAFKRSQKT